MMSDEEKSTVDSALTLMVNGKPVVGERGKALAGRFVEIYQRVFGVAPSFSTAHIDTELYDHLIQLQNLLTQSYQLDKQAKAQEINPQQVAIKRQLNIQYQVCIKVVKYNDDCAKAQAALKEIIELQIFTGSQLREFNTGNFNAIKSSLAQIADLRRGIYWEKEDPSNTTLTTIQRIQVLTSSKIPVENFWCEAYLLQGLNAIEAAWNLLAAKSLADDEIKQQLLKAYQRYYVHCSALDGSETISSLPEYLHYSIWKILRKCISLEELSDKQLMNKLVSVRNKIEPLSKQYRFQHQVISLEPEYVNDQENKTGTVADEKKPHQLVNSFCQLRWSSKEKSLQQFQQALQTIIQSSLFNNEKIQLQAQLYFHVLRHNLFPLFANEAQNNAVCLAALQSIQSGQQAATVKPSAESLLAQAMHEFYAKTGKLLPSNWQHYHSADQKTEQTNAFKTLAQFKKIFAKKLSDARLETTDLTKLLPKISGWLPVRVHQALLPQPIPRQVGWSMRKLDLYGVNEICAVGDSTEDLISKIKNATDNYIQAMENKGAHTSRFGVGFFHHHGKQGYQRIENLRAFLNQQLAKLQQVEQVEQAQIKHNVAQLVFNCVMLSGRSQSSFSTIVFEYLFGAAHDKKIPRLPWFHSHTQTLKKALSSVYQYLPKMR
jgi:hypothetical protein